MRASIRSMGLILAVGIVVAACGGRTANPVSIVRATDGQLSCSLMSAEIETNNQRARTLAKERDDARTKNALIGTAGVLLFWPALFALDLKPAEKQEIGALRDRNGHLGRLMQSKSCANIPPTSPGAADKITLDKKIDKYRNSDVKPKCSEVGGYQKFLKETGKTCLI